jgi:putative endonuclease
MWPFRRRVGDLGRYGERLAARTCRKRGMKVLAANYRCVAGEADLIALDASDGGQTLAVIEVKSRTGDTYTDPASAVNADKQRRLRAVAQHYLAGRDADGLAVRFDIVSIVARPGEKPQIDYHAGAF